MTLFQKERSQFQAVFMGPHRPPDILQSIYRCYNSKNRCSLLPLPVYFPHHFRVTLPRRHGLAWLAPNAWSPSTMEKRSVSTLTEVDAPGRAALVPMPAPSAAVEEHTQLHNVYSTIPPRGKGDKHHYKPACTHTTKYITSVDNIHASQPCTDAPLPTYIAA